MDQQGQRATRGPFWLERRSAAPQIPSSKGSEGRQGSRPARHRQLAVTSCSGIDLDNPAPARLDSEEQSAGNADRLIFELHVQQTRPHPEELRAALREALNVWHSFEQSRPCGFQRRQVRARHSARKKLGSGGLEPRLGRQQTSIELLEPIAPPGQLDCPECRLGRACDDFAQRIVDCE